MKASVIRPLAKAVTLAVAVGGAAVAQAYQAGDFIVRAGVASVQPDEDSSMLNVGGTEVAGSGAGVGSNEQLGLTAVYMLSDNLGLEVLAATPFKHDLSANVGALANGAVVNAGSTKHLPPTVSLQWFPMDSTSAFQPYVGIGVNYTIFFSEDVSPDLYANPLIGAGGAELSLDDSVGLAFEIGADIQLGNNWLLNASVWNIDIDTEAEFKFDNGLVIEADVDIDPWVYMLSIGYKF